MTVIASVPTPVGLLWIAASNQQLEAVSFSRMPGEEAPDPLLTEAAVQISRYLDGDLTRFDLPLAPLGTPFRRAVWASLNDVPYGTTTTYAALAQRLAPAGSARAVGSAVGANPWLIVVPCHRVVGRDGSLTGYAGGVERKRWLLGMELRRGLPLFESRGADSPAPPHETPAVG